MSVIVSLLISFAAPAPPPASAPAVCASLMADWERYERSMGKRYVEGIGDDSAPRAQLREMRTANDLKRAEITLSLMRDNRCPLPKQAPHDFGSE